MKALVTGAAGFIGSNVVRALLDDGHEVRALHLPGEDVRNLRGLDVELFAGDVTDARAMKEAVRGAEWVFHLAAVYALWLRDPGHMRRVNVGGTRTVLAAAREEGVARVVYTSSIARFAGPGRATEESAFRLKATGDLYSQTKNEAHEIAVAAAADHDVTIVAPTGPLGPGDVGPTPTGRILLSALTLPCAIVTSTASNFADVRDIARGHVLAATRGVRGESYLLGHRDIELPDLVRMAYAILEVDKPIVVAPFLAARIAARAAVVVADRITHKAPLFTPEAVAISELGLRADCRKAVEHLGLPQTPLETALRAALGWFAREGYVRTPSLRRRILERAA